MGRWTANSDFDYAEECGDPVRSMTRSEPPYYQRCAIPKPEPRKRVKSKKQRADRNALKALNDAVWAREREKAHTESEWARCQHCQTFVKRSGEFRRGEVHHIIGRRAKATRYDPANAELLCRDCHRKTQEHR